MSTFTGRHTESPAGNHRTLTRVSSLWTVLVLDSNGHPLNPCHPARARELIRKQRAVRICRHPYTIRLVSSDRHEAEAAPSQQESS